MSAFVAPTRAWSALRGARSDETFDLLAGRADELAAAWSESPDNIEAFAAFAEMTGAIDHAIATIERSLDVLSGPLGPCASLWLAYLCATAQSHARAPSLVAAAEAAASSPRERAFVARMLGLLAAARRDNIEAARLFQFAADEFDAADDPVGALQCRLSIAASLSIKGLVAEAQHELIAIESHPALEGLNRVTFVLTQARLQANSLQLSEASELIASVSADLRWRRAINAAALCDTTLFEIACFESRWQDARAINDRQLADAQRLGAKLHEGFALYSRALLEFDAGAMHAAIEHATNTIALGRSVGLSSLVDGGTLAQSAALAALGRVAEALVGYRTVAPPPDVRSTPSYGAGQLAVIELLFAQRASDDSARQRWIAAARARVALLARRDEHGVRFCDSNLVFREQWRRIRRVASALAIALDDADHSGDVSVSRTGTRITRADNSAISIAHRPVLARVLGALARAGELGLSADGIAAIAWPDDRSSAASMRARVRVSVASLRQLGLREAIETTATGYKLTCPVTDDDAPTPPGESHPRRDA